MQAVRLISQTRSRMPQGQREEHFRFKPGPLRIYTTLPCGHVAHTRVDVVGECAYCADYQEAFLLHALAQIAEASPSPYNETGA